jgi:hypothetical protein
MSVAEIEIEEAMLGSIVVDDLNAIAFPFHPTAK